MAEGLITGEAQPTIRNRRPSFPVWRSLQRHPTGMFGLVGLSFLILLTLMAPILAPFDPTGINYDVLLEPPNGTHWFGTDHLGRDMLSRILWGGRDTLRASFFGILVAMAGGIVIGLVSGYYGGWLDMTIMRLIDAFLAFPVFLLLLSIVAILGPGLTTLLVALGIASIPGYARLVRGSVLSARNSEYIVAAQIIGASNSRIMVHHILPNIVGVLIVYSTVGLGSAVLLAAGLSFLGLGVQPPAPEWGLMLNAGISFLRQAWWMATFPGLAIFTAVLCINLLGDGLRDALDPHFQL